MEQAHKKPAPHIILSFQREVNMSKKTLELLYGHRNYFPAKYKEKIGLRRAGVRVSGKVLSMAEIEFLEMRLKSYLECNFPPLFPIQLDTTSNWIGSEKFTVSAAMPVVSFILEGRICTADAVTITADNYPLILSAMATFNETLFWEKFESHMKLKLKKANSSKYHRVAEDIQQKVRLAVEYLKGLRH